MVPEAHSSHFSHNQANGRCLLGKVVDIFGLTAGGREELKSGELEVNTTMYNKCYLYIMMFPLRLWNSGPNYKPIMSYNITTINFLLDFWLKKA